MTILDAYFDESDVSYSSNLAVLMQEIPVRSCFALLLAFSEPLISVRSFEQHTS